MYYIPMATCANTKRARRIKGIGALAALLGVTRQHLALVLRGQRESQSLLGRYHVLSKAQRAANRPKRATQEFPALNKTRQNQKP